MNWQSYEELVKDIYQQLGKSAGVKIECWGPSCKVEGKSGVRHQIDVLASHCDGIHTYRTAIECKYWDTNIDKEPVTKLSTILEDTGIEKGVLVSKRGFTTDAQRLAKYKNVSLVRLREPVDADWDGFIKNFTVELNLIVDEVFDYRMTCANVEEKHRASFSKTIHHYKVEIGNQKVVSVCEIAEKIRRWHGVDETTQEKEGLRWSVTRVTGNSSREYVVTFPEDAKVTDEVSGATGNIRKLEFKVRERVITDDIHIDHGDYVSWIMEAIFEGRRFAISVDGDMTRWQ